MFDFIRTHQRLMQLILLVLILPSFVLIGVSGYTNYVSGDQDLVKVGDSAVTLQDFDQARRNQLQQLQQNSQGGFDPSVLDNREARSALLESLVDRRLLVNTATKERFSVSDAVLRQTISSMPQLQENGQFSPARYNQVLASVGLTTRDFEQGQRAELSLDRVLGPVALTANVPPSVVGLVGKSLTEERSVRLLAFPAEDYVKDVAVSEDDIKSWYEQNKQTLELPEQVQAQYVLLNEAAAMANLPAVGEEDLRRYYDQNKTRYVQPPRVDVSHIQISVAATASDDERKKALAKAEEIAAKAKAEPASFAELAKAESQDAGTAKDGGRLGWITKGSWPANLDQIIFSLGKGDVSDVVDGPGGFHVFHANEVQAEQGESFDEARAKVESEVRRQLGADRFAEMASKLTGLVYDNPASLQPAADELGLKIKSAAGIARDRLLPSDQVPADAASASEDAAILDDVRVRRALFSPQALAEKQNSGVIEISPDTMVAVRVEKLIPAHVPELAQVSDHIRELLVQERALAASQKAGEEALAGFQKESASDAPEKFGSVLAISRMNPQGLTKSITDAALAIDSEKLPQYLGVNVPQGYVVLRVEGGKAGELDESMQTTLSSQLAQAWGKAEEQAVLREMKVQAKVTMLPEAEEALAGERTE